MDFFKSEFKKKIANSSVDELADLLNDINISLMKAKSWQGKHQNPYGERGVKGFNVKMLKWQKCQIINRLGSVTGYGDK